MFKYDKNIKAKAIGKSLKKRETKYSFKQMAPALYKWSGRYANRDFDLRDELISIAWCTARDCPRIEFLSNRVRLDIKRYLRGKWKSEKRSRSIFAALRKGYLKERYKEDVFEQIAAKDTVEFLLSNNKFTSKEKSILKLRFIEELTTKKVGEKIGLSESRICQLLPNLLSRCKALLIEKEI